MANRYLSDLHLGHDNILKMTDRGKRFCNIDDMNAYIIREWNEHVDDSDDVWIVGDFAYRSRLAVGTYIEAMKGHKHLIIGNHDVKWMKNIRLDKYFESVSHMEVIKEGIKMITICHFPLMEWVQSRYAEYSSEGRSWQVHGHIHDSRSCDAFRYIQDKLPCALNAGFDINDHPVTLEELIRNNAKWYGRADAYHNNRV